MADMTTHLMLDCVNVDALAPYAANAFAMAGYVNGLYQSWPGIVAKYESTGKFLLSIDVLNEPSAGAQCLDIETGDASIADAPGWFKATQAAGKAANDLRFYPKLYTSAGNVQTLINTMTQNGVARNEYMIWSAHYTGTPHICSPSACGYPQADATQYADTYQGANVDASLCYGYFFAGPPVPEPVVNVPAPPPAPLPVYATPVVASMTPYATLKVGYGAPAGAGVHYQVEDANGVVVADGSTNSGSFEVTGLHGAATYKVRLAAHADAGHQASPWSVPVSVNV